MSSSDETPWLSERRGDWLADVARWVSTTLGIAIQPGGLGTVKQRPWGVVLRTAASGGVFFKAVGPGGRHETVLLADLAAAASNLAPEVIAVDHERGWLLMPDHGVEISGEGLPLQLSMIEQLLPEYAELQRVSADRTDRWVAAGVPDRSPPRLPALLDELLAGKGRTGPLPIDTDEIDGFAEAFDAFAEVCVALADGPASMAIDHADIHGTNVLRDGTRPRLIDWGDSCVGHPFTSLLVPVEWVAGRLDERDRAHAVERLVRAYLEPWGGASNRSALGYAVWAGYVARAISNDEQSAGGSSADVIDAQREIVALLQTWRAKRHLLSRPDQLVAPAMPW